MRVAVTRLKEKDSNTAEIFRDCGLEALIIPTIRSIPPEDTSSLDELVSMIEKGDIDILIFTSSLGVSNLFERCDSIPPATSIISVGPKTAQKVNEYGYPSRVLDSFSSDHFASYLKESAKEQTIGIARAGVPNPELVESLESLGAKVVEGICYELVETSNELKEAIMDHRVDAVVFTSAKSFLAGKLDKEDTKDIITVAIGPKTAEIMEKEGVVPDIVASGTLESCAEMLQDLK